MGWYVLRRLFWMVPTLLGITIITFLMMDLAPSDRATIDAQNLEASRAGDIQARNEASARLRVIWGMADPETGETYPAWQRYLNWLERACRLDFAGEGEDPGVFRQSISRALPATLLLNTLALVLALAIAIPLGAWQGLRIGSLADGLVSVLMFLLYGLPVFLLATLLAVFLSSGGWAEFFPGSGLRSPGANSWGPLAQMADMVWHLALPVLALTVAPAVILTRYVRESMARSMRSGWVLGMRAWGLPERKIARRALRSALSPVVTLLGTLVPGLISGSVVVEAVFGIQGLGTLFFDAVMVREYPMVMALTLLVSVVTLLSLLGSDILHRVVDPRVRLR